MPVKIFARESLAAKLILFALTLSLPACATSEGAKVALLAPFEGQYREIGYNALYAVRLALGDSEPQSAQLIAVDDGGTLAAAVARIKALNLDPAVRAIIALGPHATHPLAQMANDIPLIIVGNWGHDRADPDSLYAAHSALATTRQSGDLVSLDQGQGLAIEGTPISFESSGSPPDAAFHERYLNSALYVPEPNLLATLTYDITMLALAALADGITIGAAEYRGLNGRIHFEAGYWAQAPLNRFRYDGEELVLEPG